MVIIGIELDMSPPADLQLGFLEVLGMHQLHELAGVRHECIGLQVIEINNVPAAPVPRQASW